MKKTLKVLATSALVASLAAPIASPAFADTKNVVTAVPSVSDDFNSADSTNQKALTWLFLKVDKVNNKAQTFRIQLDNADFSKEFYVANQGISTADSASYQAPTAAQVTVQSVSDRTLTLNLTTAGATEMDTNGLYIPLYVEADGSGPVTAEIQSIDGTITQGKYTVANVSGGSTTTVVEDVKTITSGSTGTLGSIRIDENAIGSLYENTTDYQKVTLKLPSNYEWVGGSASSQTGKLVASGGFADKVDFYYNDANGNKVQDADIKDILSSNNRTLEFYVKFSGKPSTRGSIYIEGAKVKVDSGASYTDEVKLSVSGTKVSSQDVVVAKNKDFGLTASVDEVKEIVAGKWDEDDKTGKITLKETVANSIIKDRNLEIKLPDSVKVIGGVSGIEAEGASDFSKDVNSDGNVITLVRTTGTSKAELKLKLKLAVEADYTGDIKATIKGAGIPEQEVVIAKAVTPITAEMSGDNSVKIGVQGQAAPEIILTEGAKEALAKDKKVVLTLPSGVSFSAVPTVTVTEGDLEIKKESVKRDGNTLSFEIKSESTKASKIKLSNVQLTVDRNVPEGQIELKVGGPALVDATNENKFNTENAVKFNYAKVITPAPGDTTASNIVFKLNAKTFTIDGKEFTMDTAPLVAWDRAFLPIRFAANALNVSDDNIIWDEKTSTATIFKGDRVVVAKVGDKFLTVNGAKVPMDVPVYRSAATNNRVMIPVRYLSNALGANIQWNQETNEITIEAAK